QADLEAVGGRVLRTYPAGPSLVALPPWVNRNAALARLRADRDVAYAEADGTFHATGIVIPNDPLFPQEWGMALIDAPQAWGVTRGTPATIVAVLDTGVDLGNPDFAGRIWTNPHPTGGDVHGWNFVTNTPNIQDSNGHGTHVTGILAAAG